MQSKSLIEQRPRLIFCSAFLKCFKRKRQDFILWPIILLFLYCFIFPSSNYGCKSISQNFCLGILLYAQTLWERMSHPYMYMCLWRGFLLSVLSQAIQGTAFVWKKTLQKYEVPDLHVSQKVKFRHFTGWNQWRKNVHCHIINKKAITVLHSKSPKPRKLPSLWNSLCLFQGEGSLTSYPREWGRNVKCWKMQSSRHPPEVIGPG